jgi:hypothetical protein
MLNIGRVKIHRPKTERRGAQPSEPGGSDGLVWGIIITAGGQASWSLIKAGKHLRGEWNQFQRVIMLNAGRIQNLKGPRNNRGRKQNENDYDLL